MKTTQKKATDSSIKKSKKLFSIKWKMLIIFAVLTYIVGHTCISVTLTFARQALIERVAIQLKATAKDTAREIKIAMNGDFQHLETIARMAMFRDMTISYTDKAIRLEQEAKNSDFRGLYILDAKGLGHFSNGDTNDASASDFYKIPMQGKNYISEPYLDRFGDFCISVSVPIYDNNKNIIGVLLADYDGMALCKYVKDILIGDTGYVYIIGKTGNVIAINEHKYVKEQWNSTKAAKKDPKFLHLAEVEQKALQKNSIGNDEWDWDDGRIIGAYANMPSTGWGVIVRAPKHEFFNSIDKLRFKAIAIGIVIYIIALIIIFIVFILLLF